MKHGQTLYEKQQRLQEGRHLIIEDRFVKTAGGKLVNKEITSKAVNVDEDCLTSITTSEVRNDKYIITLRTAANVSS